MPADGSELRLRNVREILVLVEQGLNDVLTGTPNRRFAAVTNISVYGRAVTSFLQKLRYIEPGFEVWYNKYRKEMQDDSLMKYMYNLRSEILKAAEFKKLENSAYIKSFNTSTDMAKLGPRPPYAKGFVMGDRYGGSGWVVELPDGTEQTHYVELPSEIGTSNLHFADAPKMHLGKQLEDDTIQTVCRLYVEYLQRMVRDAETKFGKR